MVHVSMVKIGEVQSSIDEKCIVIGEVLFQTSKYIQSILEAWS